MNKQQLLEKLQLINEMTKRSVAPAAAVVATPGQKNKIKPKPWQDAEKRIKSSMKKIGHEQCAEQGGCGHQVDAMIHGVGVSIGHGHEFSGKDVGQGTLKFVPDGLGGRKWTHSATSTALQRHIEKKQFTSGAVGGLGGAEKTISRKPTHLLDIMTKHYGTTLEAPKKPIKSGREMKHLNDEAYHIHTGGEMYLPMDGTILADHHKEHHGSMYHIQHVTVSGKNGKSSNRAHLYRTSEENPLNILDKQGNAPPILGQGLKVSLRIRAKDSVRQKATGFYNRRAVTAIKVHGKVKDSPSTIDMLRPHHTIHSTSGIFTDSVNKIKAKKHEI
jgi:hypothetical protein